MSITDLVVFTFYVMFGMGLLQSFSESPYFKESNLFWKLFWFLMYLFAWPIVLGKFVSDKVNDFENEFEYVDEDDETETEPV